jgi:hypothetical protein
VVCKRDPGSRGRDTEGDKFRARGGIISQIQKQEEGEMDHIAFTPFYLIQDSLQSVKDGRKK